MSAMYLFQVTIFYSIQVTIFYSFNSHSSSSRERDKKVKLTLLKLSRYVSLSSFYLYLENGNCAKNL